MWKAETGRKVKVGNRKQTGKLKAETGPSNDSGKRISDSRKKPVEPENRFLDRRTGWRGFTGKALAVA